MAELRISDPSWLRDRAAHCRELAGRSVSESTAQELLEFAQEYEADAANLESGKSPTKDRNALPA